jgi:hypothetical protein
MPDGQQASEQGGGEDADDDQGQNPHPDGLEGPEQFIPDGMSLSCGLGHERTLLIKGEININDLYDKINNFIDKVISLDRFFVI